MAPATVANEVVHRIVEPHQDIQVRKGAQNAACDGGPPWPQAPAQNGDADAGA